MRTANYEDQRMIDFESLVNRFEDKPCFIVGVDGCGGAGKSTFASQLCEAWTGSTVIHTDDFASWDCPLDWWPRMVEQVFEPLNKGLVARYQKYDWVEKRLHEWEEVAPGRIVVEGVSATRRGFDPYIDFRIWIDTPREERLRRGLERDGLKAEPLWKKWMAQEDRYVLLEDPMRRADVLISGEKLFSVNPI